VPMAWQFLSGLEDELDQTKQKQKQEGKIC
jgi:hypothetical protein